MGALQKTPSAFTKITTGYGGDTVRYSSRDRHLELMEELYNSEKHDLENINKDLKKALSLYAREKIGF